LIDISQKFAQSKSKDLFRSIIFIVENRDDVKEALFYEKLFGDRVRCELCPHRCTISPGHRGICGVRENRDGRLATLNYRLLSSVNLDPIEKKPLYHFFPGSKILSIGSFGCNLQCRFCQNHEISQVPAGVTLRGNKKELASIVAQAEKSPQNIGIAYTYNEPVISYETVLETARLVQKKGMKNAMITNGYITPNPLAGLLPFIDAFNVDLKANDEQFYHRYTASRLAPVKETLVSIRKAGKHLEVTNLVIPGLNDDEGRFLEMVQWIAIELGRETPLHLSRYFPRHHFTIPPTPEKTLLRLFEIARYHLDYVYIGNFYTPFGQDTRCPACHAILISRAGYNVSVHGLKADGTCKDCNRKAEVVIE
jgi:pyruvate formate lyase activating enzyme